MQFGSGSGPSRLTPPVRTSPEYGTTRPRVGRGRGGPRAAADKTRSLVEADVREAFGTPSRRHSHLDGVSPAPGEARCPRISWESKREAERVFARMRALAVAIVRE